MPNCPHLDKCYEEWMQLICEYCTNPTFFENECEKYKEFEKE